MTILRWLTTALLLAGSTGCSILFGSVVDSAANATGRTIGNEAGNRAGNAAVASAGGPQGSPQGSVNVNMGGNAGMSGGAGMGGAAMNPMYTQIYMSMIFSMAFSSGGYSVAPVDYKPGEYTRWTLPNDNGKESTMERAHLFDDASGNQWWKVKFINGKDNSTIVLEGLLSPTTNKFLRMRGKFPGDDVGKEMPVDDQSYYAPPRKLSKESIQGAIVGTDSLTLKAGTFNAQHVVYGDMGGSHEWWIDTSVPGGTVRQMTKGAQGRNKAYDMQLAAYGSDAKSELGVTP